MENKIIIDVTNQVQLQAAPSGETMQPSGAGVNWSAISSQFLVSGARKLVGATGNSQLSGFLRESGKYGFAAMRIIASGGTDIAAIAGMALDIGAEALRKANENARKIAKTENEVDMARIKAGLLDISNTNNITQSWWSGRYRYGRGG